MLENIWFIAAAWMGLALVGSLISIWTGISVALVEILIGVVAGNAHDTGIVLPGLRDAVKERAEFKGNDLHAHSELFQVVLEKRRHFGAVGIGRAGEDAELNRLSVGILKRRFAA